MNFYCNSQGSIHHVDPELIYQGSANTNEVNFIGAFPANAKVLINYRLPNGKYTIPQMMAYNRSLTDVQDKKGNAYNVWSIMLGSRYDEETDSFVPDYIVTEHFGQLKIQFEVILADSKGNPQTLAISEAWVEVIQTSAVVEPTVNDGYMAFMQQVLAALSAVERKWITGFEEVSVDENGRTYKITYNDGTDFFFTANGAPGPAGPPGKDGTVTFEELSDEQKESLKGDRGPQGDSGVYIGSDTPPDSANVWIDPNGVVNTFEMRAVFEDGTEKTYIFYGEESE